MEKQTVFIKVKVEKRHVGKRMFCTSFRNEVPRAGKIEDYGDYFVCAHPKDEYGTTGAVITHVLEEIELPSKEEIYSESFKSDKTPKDFIKGANFILNHLKSNTNETDKI